MATSKLTLGYWNIRGHAEPARTLLEYLQLPYENEKFNDNEGWAAKKASFGARFANLPYLIDNGKVVTESEAVFAYICLKGGRADMAGKPEDLVEFLQLKGVVMDVRTGLSRMVYGAKDKEGVKTNVEQTMGTKGAEKFKDLNEILGEKEWLLGYLTYVDFMLAELLERFTDIDSELGTTVMGNYPNLQAHLKRFLELPGVKDYRASDRFQARPYNMAHAGWV